jgi:hypothetical protein
MRPGGALVPGGSARLPAVDDAPAIDGAVAAYAAIVGRTGCAHAKASRDKAGREQHQGCDQSHALPPVVKACRGSTAAERDFSNELAAVRFRLLRQGECAVYRRQVPVFLYFCQSENPTSRHISGRYIALSGADRRDGQTADDPPETRIDIALLHRRGVPFSNPLKDTEEGLRGFEITDPDGYVLFFGCSVCLLTS